jgi:hypothetical protein
VESNFGGVLQGLLLVSIAYLNSTGLEEKGPCQVTARRNEPVASSTFIFGNRSMKVILHALLNHNQHYERAGVQ